MSIDYSRLIQDDRVHSLMYTSPEVFQDEMKRIFETGWVFVAHESQIPNPGDYITRRIGRQSLIFSRGDDGSLNLLYDRCTHRGNRVTTADSGNVSNFLCVYHGWAFNTRGKFVAMPAATRFPQSAAEEQHLARVPRLETYGGFVFASLAAEGVTLDEYLGKSKSLIDMINGLAPGGRIRLDRGWIKHRLRGNWKGLVENQCDGYHPAVTHGSVLKTNKNILEQRDRRDTSPSRTLDLGHGHSELDFAADFRARDVLLGWAGKADPKDFPKYIAAMNKAYGEEDARRRLVDGPPHGVIFPNLLFAEMNFMVVEPVSIDETFQYSTPIMLDGGEEMNVRTLHRCVGALGPAGMLIADDGEMAEMLQRGISTDKPEWALLKMGLEAETIRPDGVRVGDLKDETAQRGMWRHYKKVMVEA